MRLPNEAEKYMHVACSHSANKPKRNYFAYVDKLEEMTSDKYKDQ